MLNDTTIKESILKIVEMDKTFFIKQSLSQAEQHQQFYSNLSQEDKAGVFLAMMQAAYGFIGKEERKINGK